MNRTVVVALITLVISGCGVRGAHAPRAPATDAQLRALTLPRVWVAGFVTSDGREFDLNAETVSLLRAQLRRYSSATVDAEPLIIDSEQRLADVPYWKRMGDEHGAALIVTGAVKLFFAPPRIVQVGPRTMFAPAAGRVLEATVILIDGHTGEIVSRRMLPSRMRYGLGRFSSGASLYFAMMDEALPDWVDAIAVDGVW